jgi:putative sigma-54 modulation protein
MIQVDITARNMEVSEKLRDYAEAKIGGLEKYLPRKVRDIAIAALVLELDPNGHEANQYVCDAILTLPGAKMVAKEGTINIFASIDIVEAKLRSQLSKYKDKQTTEPRRGRMLTRLLGRVSETDPTVPSAE